MPIVNPEEVDKMTGTLSPEEQAKASRHQHRNMYCDDDPRKPATEYPWWYLKWGSPVLLMKEVGLVQVVGVPDLTDRTVLVEEIKNKEKHTASWYSLYDASEGEALRKAVRDREISEEEKDDRGNVTKQKKKRRRAW